MADYKKIIHRANIHELRSLFLEGLDLENDNKQAERDDYEKIINQGEQPLMEFIEKLYPNGSVRDAVFELVSNAILVNQQVYTELGMRLGA